mmetsp:Transcript_19795/g.49528  ORF Transcript_19795/g.49528 Transcript_19795/m.49528 type:complete len:118 (-) Transcript_19795:3-356(-)
MSIFTFFTVCPIFYKSKKTFMEIEGKKTEYSYIPRKCSFSNQILASKDHSSIQVSVKNQNLNNLVIKNCKTYAISGVIRRKGLSDRALNLLTEECDFLQKISTKVKLKQEKKKKIFK